MPSRACTLVVVVDALLFCVCSKHFRALLADRFLAVLNLVVSIIVSSSYFGRVYYCEYQHVKRSCICLVARDPSTIWLTPTDKLA